MFAGTGGNGIYKSINSGQNWTKTSMIAFYVPCLAQNGSTIFAGADNGVQYSTDNGLTWNETSFTNEIVFSMAFNGSTVFAGGGYGFHISTNGGLNWTATAFHEVCLSLVMNGNNLYAGTYNGVLFYK